jgi:hypothetical protein
MISLNLNDVHGELRLLLPSPLIQLFSPPFPEPNLLWCTELDVGVLEWLLVACGGVLVCIGAPMVGAKGAQRWYIYLLFNKTMLLPRSTSSAPYPMCYKFVTLYYFRAMWYNLVTQFRYLEIMCYYLATPSIKCYKFVTLFTSLILCVTNSGWTQLVCY